MKKKALIIICCGLALFAGLLAALTDYLPAVFSSTLAFPFEQFAALLGLLSKTGPVGNGVAAALWAGLASIPLIFALRGKKGRETMGEKAALILMSAALLISVWGMADPGLFSPAAAAGEIDAKIIKAILGGMVWSVCVLCIVLRLIRMFRQGNKAQLYKYLRVVFGAICCLLSASAAFSLVKGAISLFSVELPLQDTAVGIITLAAAAVPYVFDIAILIRANDLFDIASREGQDGVAEAAGKVSGACCVFLGVTAAITAVVNIIQALGLPWLSNITVTLDMPVFSIALAVVALLFARLIDENKQLRDENSMFI